MGKRPPEGSQRAAAGQRKHLELPAVIRPVSNGQNGVREKVHSSVNKRTRALMELQTINGEKGMLCRAVEADSTGFSLPRSRPLAPLRRIYLSCYILIKAKVFALQVIVDKKRYFYHSLTTLIWWM
jgi:hypothetical protein